MKTESRNELIEFFKPHNERLFKMINKKFDWDKQELNEGNANN